MQNIVIFGAPGAGKGTHAEMLAKRYDLFHLSTGDCLRREVAADSELGRRIKSVMNKGELVSDEIVTRLVNRTIIENERGILFDGFPRNEHQAFVLDMLLRIYHQALSCVIRLDVPREELVRRIHERALISGRVDDADDDIIRRRLDAYENKTFPVLGYYRSSGQLITIDAGGSIEQTQQRIIEAVTARMGE